MNRVRTKLRMALSQPWAVWTLFAAAVGVYGFLVLAEARSERFARFRWSLWVPIAVFLGRVALGWHTPDDTMATPLSFMLSGYRESLRKTSFSRAIRWGTIFCMWSFSNTWSRLLLSWEVRQIWSVVPSGLPSHVSLPPEPSSLEMSLSIVGGFLGGAALCFLWTIGSLVHCRRRWLNAPFMGLWLIVIAVLVWSPEPRQALIFWPILTVLSASFCLYFWVRLGDRDWVKSGHRNILMRAIERPASVEIGTTTRPPVEEWFRERMQRYDYLRPGRSLWGSMYRAFGPISSYWRWVVVLLLASTLVLGYVSRLFVELAFLAFGAVAYVVVLSDSSYMLLPEGRRERCCSDVVAGVATSLMLAAVGSIVTGFSGLFAILIPEIRLEDYSLRYAGIGVGSIWLTCLAVPWLFASCPTGHRVPIMRGVIASTAGLLSIAAIFLRYYGFSDGRILLAIVFVCGWLFFLLSQWITYRTWDLAGQ